MAAKGRQFVYRYDGDPKSEEVEEDMFDEIPVPQQNAVIERKGKRWKVVAVNTEVTVSLPRAVPIYRVFLATV